MTTPLPSNPSPDEPQGHTPGPVGQPGHPGLPDRAEPEQSDSDRADPERTDPERLDPDHADPDHADTDATDQSTPEAPVTPAIEEKAELDQTKPHSTDEHTPEAPVAPSLEETAEPPAAGPATGPATEENAPRQGALPALLASLAESHDPASLPAPPEPPEWSEPLLRDLIYAFLIWEASAGQASTAMRRIESSVVDYNELRVYLAEEIVRLIGERYPRSRERAERLKAALQEIFEREHTLSLEHLREISPEEARSYLDALEGMPPFVSARVTLLSLGGRAFPVDGRICALLVGQSVCEARTTLEGIAEWIESQLPATEAPAAYNLMEAWCEANPSARRRRTPRAASRTPRRTSASQNDE